MATHYQHGLHTTGRSDYWEQTRHQPMTVLPGLPQESNQRGSLQNNLFQQQYHKTPVNVFGASVFSNAQAGPQRHLDQKAFTASGLPRAEMRLPAVPASKVRQRDFTPDLNVSGYHVCVPHEEDGPRLQATWSDCTAGEVPVSVSGERASSTATALSEEKASTRIQTTSSSGYVLGPPSGAIPPLPSIAAPTLPGGHLPSGQPSAPFVLPPGPPVAPVGQWQNIPHVYSSRQLLPLRSSAQGRGSWHPDDKVVHLPTFQSLAYVSCHPSTVVEFDRYISLVKHGLEDAWYRLPDAVFVAQMNSLEQAGLPTGSLPIIQDARPKKLEIPRVHGGAALRTSDTVPILPCENPAHFTPTESHAVDEADCNSDSSVDRKSKNLRNALLCKRCTKSKQRAFDASSVVYISVVQTIQDHHNPVNGISPPFSTPGSATAALCTPLYKIVKSGSRDAAATQAFYDAGANGWSTVFTCAIRSDVDWAIAVEEGIRRVDELWKLGDDAQSAVCIFY